MKKINPERAMKLINEFRETIVLWCKENEFSLHDVFRESRSSDKENHKILIELYSSYMGKEYLKSYFRSRGGVLKKLNKA